MIRLETLDWSAVTESLNERGYALLRNVLSAPECKSLRELYTDNTLYRSTVNMERYRFGKGEYKYFQYPLPDIVEGLRKAFYPPLAKVANEWMRHLNIETAFPETHERLIGHCSKHGQLRPTPLILRYEKGGFNTLHQDLYGLIYFPFQIVLILNKKERDFTGGDFVMVEQVPRAQSKAKVIQPGEGDAVIFTTNFRPVKSSKGYYRSTVKHGVSEVESGVRYALGVIFHDAS